MTMPSHVIEMGKQRTLGLFSTLVEMSDEPNGGVIARTDADATAARDLSSTIGSDGNHWTTILLVTFSSITITVNVLLLLLFTKRRSLRTVSNRFVTNLLFISLLSSAILVPFIILDLELVDPSQNGGLDVRLPPRSDYFNITNDTPLELTTPHVTHVASLLAQFTLNFICTASILSILLIGVDQYLAVLHPMRCHSYMSKPKSLLLIVASYLVSFISASLVALIDGNGSFFPNLSHHRYTTIATAPAPCCSSRNVWVLGYGIFYLAGVLTTPFITICIIYVLIYRAAHRNSERLRRSHFDGTPKRSIPKVHSAPNFIAHINQAAIADQMGPLVATRKEIGADLTKAAKIERTHSDRIPSIITSLRTKISNASAFRYREENRTAKISIIVIVMVLACYAPYGVVYLLASIRDARTAGNLQVPNRIALALLVSANLWSPVLFALRNRRVQRELRRFLSFYAPQRGYACGANRRHSRPQIVIQHIDSVPSKLDCVVQIEPFLSPDAESNDDVIASKELRDAPVKEDSKSILKRVCSKNWSSYKKCSFITVPDGCLDARGSFSSASTQISTEE